MYKITLNIPEETALALKTPLNKLEKEISLITAVKLYELGKLSAGSAAHLAGIPKTLFLSKLADYGVDTFNLTEEELLEDLLNA